MAVLTIVDAAAGIRLARPEQGQSGTVNAGTFKAGEVLVAGDVVYKKTSDGKIWKALATGAADAENQQVFGIVLEDTPLDDWRTVFREAILSGFAGVDDGDRVYLSDTAGKLDTAAGTNSVVLGVAWTRREGDVVHFRAP